MHKKLLIALMLTLTVGFVACTSGSDGKETATANLKGNDYLVTIKTDLGEMKAVLFDLTPKHKENFVKLAGEGFYDELLFHRVMQGFMIQGGDPTSKGAAPEVQLGMGGPGYQIDAEITPALYHRKGALAAARTPNREKRSSGSQFYIVQGQPLPASQVQYNEVAMSRAVGLLMRQYPNDSLSNQLRTAMETGGQQAYIDKCLELESEITSKTNVQYVFTDEQKEVYTTMGGRPDLDGEYTVFGQVISGLDVLDKIAAVETAPGNRPVEDVKMYITVEEMPRSKIASKYSFTDFQ